jgi:ankyrin repeat protein
MTPRRAAWPVVLILASAAGMAAGGDDARLVDAVRAGDGQVVRTLLAAGGSRAAVNAEEADGTTALHWAVRADDLDTVGLLLAAGANVNRANRYGITPLSLAALNGNPDMIERLVDAGADPNAVVSDGETAALIAARTGNPRALAILLDHGADVNAREQLLGENAVMWAAMENHPEAIAVLAAHGADLDARSAETRFPRRDFGDGKSGRFTVLPRGGWTALMYAARQNAQGALRTLADAGANLDLVDPDGTTALTLAIINGHYDAALELLDLGADPNVADVKGMTPLYAAIDMHTLDETPGRPEPKPEGTHDSLDAAAALLAHGADPNARLLAPILERVHNNGDPQLGSGATPLMRAAKKGDSRAARLLLDHGADAGAAMANGATAVMFAAGYGGAGRFAVYDTKRGTDADFIDIVTRCLERGADINAVNDAGQTALHAAVVQRDEAFVRVLAGHGAQLDVHDKQGRTPLDIALGAGGRGRGGAPPIVHEGAADVLRELIDGKAGSGNIQSR